MASSPRPPPPRIIDGKYAVLRTLGTGSAGSVYEAEELGSGERRAVKVLCPALASDPAIRARFLAEGRAAARIAHENVVDIHDVGVAADGSVFIVMSLIDGDTLEQVLDAGGPLPIADACELMLQVLAGLSAAHANGIVHRDLKPANVLVQLSSSDRPIAKVLDFGIAQGLIDGDSQAPPRGVLLGTPAYMAPEQALGRPVSSSADVYAVCAMLYELVSGCRPFEGEEANHVLSRVVCSDFVSLRDQMPELPEALLAAVELGMLADPEQRISSDELARTLAIIAREQRPSAPLMIDPSSRMPIPEHAQELSEFELMAPTIPRLPPAPRDAATLDGLCAEELTATPSERARRHTTTLPAESSRSARPSARSELWVLLGGIVVGMLLSGVTAVF